MSVDGQDKERELEQWLDVALVRHVSVEPRIGLENRLLAGLQAERGRLAVRRQWWWGLGTAVVAATVAIAMWIGLHERQPVPNRAAGNSMTQGRSATVSGQVAPERPPVSEDAQGMARTLRRPVRPAISARTSEPKLDQFPSPEPLTDQEKLLARYVQEFPERAVLIARAQTQLRKQEEQQRLGLSPRTTDPESSDQTE
jgi:hypothetical protein